VCACQLLYGSDALRAKVLHWHKATFFPDFMPRGDANDDEADIGSEEEEEEVFEEPSTARRVAYVASTTLVDLPLPDTTELSLLNHTLFVMHTGVCDSVQFDRHLHEPARRRTHRHIPRPNTGPIY
jgi:hypothetical protein